MKLKISSFLKAPPPPRELVRKGIATNNKAFCGPEHVVIDLTNRCNNSCIACWTRSPLLSRAGPNQNWHRQELNTVMVLELIDELHHMGTKIVRFTGGGEPMLHPGINEVICKVKSHGMYCAVTTSFTTVTEDGVSKLMASGVDELSVSLWASTAKEYVETHPNQSEKIFNRITKLLRQIRYRKAYMKFISPLRLFNKNVPYVNILNVICNLNYDSIEAMYDYAFKVGSDAIYYTAVDPIEGSTDALLMTNSQRETARLACKVVRQKNNQVKNRRRLFLDNFDNFEARLSRDSAINGFYDQTSIDSIPCYVGWIFCRIMANGHVAPCCRGVHIPMGDINERSFSSIWYSKRYNSFRKKAKNYPKSHPYFKAFECQKTCDNLMHNLEIHRWLSSSSPQ